jgi:hypothetical protein
MTAPRKRAWLQGGDCSCITWVMLLVLGCTMSVWVAFSEFGRKCQEVLGPINPSHLRNLQTFSYLAFPWTSLQFVGVVSPHVFLVYGISYALLRQTSSKQQQPYVQESTHLDPSHGTFKRRSSIAFPPCTTGMFGIAPSVLIRTRMKPSIMVTIIIELTQFCPSCLQSFFYCRCGFCVEILCGVLHW